MKSPEAGNPERAALSHLKRAHPELHAAALPHMGAILSRVAPKRTSQALFESLASSIVSQQLSTKAAASIYARLKEKLGGKITPAGILNAANEVAVSAFLQGRIGFLSIPALVEHALSTLPATNADTLEALLAADAQSRRLTDTALARHALNA